MLNKTELIPQTINMGLDDKEMIQEEPTPAEIAEACREVLDAEVCEEISAMEDGPAGLELAFTALEEVGKNAEQFLKSKGILE